MRRPGNRAPFSLGVGVKRKTLLVGASVVAVAAVSTGAYLAPLAAEPDGPKDCGSALPDLPGQAAKPDNKIPAPTWKQQGGQINDASCLSRTAIAGVVDVRSAADVAKALAYAKAKGLSVSAAGVKHSMGGQAFRQGGVVLDMRGLNGIRLDPEAQTITVGSGATWHDIQNAIHPRFAVKAMQSTDIFTVGGSISVNAHGMDHQAGALMDSIRSIKVMLADGSIVTASREENDELFRHVVGGYGLFGIVLEATLDVVPNAIYSSERSLIAAADYPKAFAAIEADPDIGLTYTHLSTAPGSFLDEALVYRYRRVKDEAGLERQPLREVSSTKLRRLTVNLAKRSDAFAGFKWWSEKVLESKLENCTVTRAQAMQDGEACFVSRNDPMHDSVPYLFNALPKETDILHEYFVPRAELPGFIKGMKAIFQGQPLRLLNASIRAVGKEENVLTYAPEPAFSMVLYVNQPTDAAGNAAQADLTRKLIDLTLKHRGRFFLPYQLHYTPEQLLASYPEFPAFVAAKRKWDPDGLFRNSWYDRYSPSVG